jgi:hypothetical protein
MNQSQLLGVIEGCCIATATIIERRIDYVSKAFILAGSRPSWPTLPTTLVISFRARAFHGAQQVYWLD